MFHLTTFHYIVLLGVINVVPLVTRFYSTDTPTLLFSGYKMYHDIIQQFSTLESYTLCEF